MSAKWPLWASLAAGCVGLAILAAWFSKYWPASSWQVLPRTELIARARAVSEHFGVNPGNSKPSLVVSLSKPLANAGVSTISPLSVRLSWPNAEVGLDSAGIPLYWKASDEAKPPKTDPSEVFAFLAGDQASSFSGPAKSMGDEASEDQYVWKKTPPPHSDVRERITVSTKDGAIQKAERKVYLFSEDEDDDDSDSVGKQAYWGVFSAIFWTCFTAAIVTIFSMYLLWSMRKALSHRFQGRMAIAAAVIIAAALLAGANADKGSDWAELWAALEVLCVVGVGRAISTSARPKWFSLEQLCRLAPLSKAAGESLAAGVLASPLLAAIPYLIAGCGLFPHSTVVPQNLGVLYSPVPLLDTGNLPAVLFLLGFWGFGMPVLARIIRFRWLRWMVALPLGTVFFAYQTRLVTGPLAAPLTAGFCTLALFWFLYSRFDILAVLTLQLAGGVVLAMFMLAHKGLEIGLPAAALLAVLATAFRINTRGASVSEGDPSATNPALSGFRAEREKLQAEFSVARRAQQGMLPQSAPEIPGYSIAASCTPSLDVGGDLYDFLKLPDGRIGIGVADVSGKGVPAALYMTLTKGLLASVSKDNSELAGVVEEVNRHLHGVTRKKVFVTMALGFLDAEKRVLQCVRAGHNPVVWRQASRDLTTLVAPGGLGLGITASRVFANQLKMVELELSEGDSVVFYSDGITEAMNSSLEQFGEQRLMEAVEKTDRLDAAAAHDSILSTVREFLSGVHPQDDMTLVVLRVGAR